MREDKGFFGRLFIKGTPECAIACGLIGVLVALMLLWAGIWRTLLVASLIAVGVFIGGVKDKRAFFRKLLGRFDRDQ